MSSLNLDKRANNALNANPNLLTYAKSADISITTHGSDWYWAVTAVMTFSTFVFLGLSLTKPHNKRLFHYITAGITLVASIAYFTLASNLGWAPIAVEFQRSNPKVHGVYRQIEYVRYIDWVITTPLLLLDLLLTAGMPTPFILWTILLDEIMIVTGLIGALVASSYKWGYYVFGCVAFFGVVYNVVIVARAHAKPLGADIHRSFLICGVWTIALWFLYPIAWGLCEGGNVISSDSEAVFYGILDILAKPIFGALLIWGHRNIEPSRLGLHIRDPADDPSLIGATHGRHHEKNGTTAGGLGGHHDAVGTANMGADGTTTGHTVGTV